MNPGRRPLPGLVWGLRPCVGSSPGRAALCGVCTGLVVAPDRRASELVLETDLLSVGG